MKKIICILITLLMAAAAFGCAASSKSEASTVAPAPYEQPSMAAGSADNTAGQTTAAETGKASDSGVYDESSGLGSDVNYGNHKIITTYTIEMTTDEFDTHFQMLKDKCTELGGYVQSCSVNGTKPENYNDPGRYASIAFRIPSDQAEAFAEYTSGTGTITSSNSNTQDITLEYYDSETRLSVLKTQLTRLESILVKTDNLADIIELEKEIARVTTEIEEMTTQLRKYDDLIDYTTVYVNISENRLTQGPAATMTMGERISKGFADTMNGLGVFFENFAVGFIVALPVILVVLVFVAAAVFIVWWIVLLIRSISRAMKKNGDKRRAARALRDAQRAQIKVNKENK